MMKITQELADALVKERAARREIEAQMEAKQAEMEAKEAEMEAKEAEMEARQAEMKARIDQLEQENSQLKDQKNDEVISKRLRPRKNAVKKSK
jgi:hypothetical protein